MKGRSHSWSSLLRLLAAAAAALLPQRKRGQNAAAVEESEEVPVPPDTEAAGATFAAAVAEWYGSLAELGHADPARIDLARLQVLQQAVEAAAAGVPAAEQERIRRSYAAEFGLAEVQTEAKRSQLSRLARQDEELTYEISLNAVSPAYAMLRAAVGDVSGSVAVMGYYVAFQEALQQYWRYVMEPSRFHWDDFKQAEIKMEALSKEYPDLPDKTEWGLYQRNLDAIKTQYRDLEAQNPLEKADSERGVATGATSERLRVWGWFVTPELRDWPEAAAAEQSVSVPPAWEVPLTPLQLDGTSPQEQKLRDYINRLNTVKVPKAAAYYVLNRQIAGMTAAGNPPASALPVPPLGDPGVQAVIARLRWDQGKINRVWEEAGKNGLDPCLMLAVILQEGTGSFNTNGSVTVQWFVENRYVPGGHGPEPDFEQDLARAMNSHILAKVAAYGYYAVQFQVAVQAAGLGDGNVFQYANYNVPWYQDGRWEVRPGCYATHTTWWQGVRDYFEDLLWAGAAEVYSQYLAQHPVPVAPDPPPVRFGLTSGGTGPTEEETGRPWIEAFPQKDARGQG